GRRCGLHMPEKIDCVTAIYCSGAGAMQRNAFAKGGVQAVFDRRSFTCNANERLKQDAVRSIGQAQRLARVNMQHLHRDTRDIWWSVIEHAQFMYLGCETVGRVTDTVATAGEERLTRPPCFREIQVDKLHDRTIKVIDFALRPPVKRDAKDVSRRDLVLIQRVAEQNKLVAKWRIDPGFHVDRIVGWGAMAE